MLLWLLAGDDHSTGCTRAVVRATSAAAAGYDENDDCKKNNRAGNSACNRPAAPTTVRRTNSSTAILSTVTLVVGRTGTRRRTTTAFAITAFLARSTFVVVRAGTARRRTTAFAITAFLAPSTLVIVRTETTVSADIITTGLTIGTITVVGTVGSTSQGKETDEKKALKFLWGHCPFTISTASVRCGTIIGWLISKFSPDTLPWKPTNKETKNVITLSTLSSFKTSQSLVNTNLR